jgi:hypothetical protein
MSNNSRVLFYAVFGMLVLVWLRVGWVLIYPHKPIVFQNVKIQNEKKEVLPGEKLILTVSYTGNIGLPASVYRQLVNTYVMSTTHTETKLPAGSGTLRESVHIPEYAEPGKYRVVISYIYLVSEWPIHRETVQWESEEFTVLRPGVSAQLSEAVQEVRSMLEAHRKKSTYDRAK